MQPACSRCKQLGLACEYVKTQRGQVFINRSAASPFVKAIDILSNAGRITLPDTNEKTGTEHVEAQVQAAIELARDRYETSIPNSPDQGPMDRMQQFSTFIGLYLPRVAQGPAIPGRSPVSWVHTLPSLAITNHAYTISIKALCAAHIGAWNCNHALVMESHRLYGSALRELRNTLASRKLVAPEATLASIIILSTYEVSRVKDSDTPHKI